MERVFSELNKKDFHDETESGFAALLGIGLLEGSGDLHAGTT